MHSGWEVNVEAWVLAIVVGDTHRRARRINRTHDTDTDKELPR